MQHTQGQRVHGHEIAPHSIQLPIRIGDVPAARSQLYSAASHIFYLDLVHKKERALLGRTSLWHKCTACTVGLLQLKGTRAGSPSQPCVMILHVMVVSAHLVAVTRMLRVSMVLVYVTSLLSSLDDGSSPAAFNSSRSRAASCTHDNCGRRLSLIHI